MNPSAIEILRRLSSPLEPLPTGTEPFLGDLPEIRCILFDMYGTLFASDSGDLQATRADRQLTAMRAVLTELHLDPRQAPDWLIRFRETIEGFHERSRENGIEFPEVDIRDVWRVVAPGPSAAEGDAAGLQRYAERLAVEYEARANPVWPMPGLESTLRALSGQLTVGLISNAQFYTPLLFPALIQCAASELGLDEALCFFSYQSGLAKPGIEMYREAAARLQSRNIEPRQVLYVGNDMLNDVWPAAQTGFRTALFAGDRRSLRLRSDDPRVQTTRPDLIVTELPQLISWIQRAADARDNHPGPR